MSNYRILLLNMSYCLGMTGSIANYSLRAYRYLYCPKKIQEKVLERISGLIKERQPDLCCFIEIDQGSKISNRINQMKKLVCCTHPYHNIENKYGKLLKKLPIPHLKKQSNGFLSKKNHAFKTHYFKNGSKKLIYEIILKRGVHLFLAHFALNKSVRKKQFKYLESLLAGKTKIIVCGDFNIKDTDEIRNLIARNNLRLINGSNDKTFPSYQPKKAIDLFLCSKNIKVNDCHVLKNVIVSDHLPVILETSL